MGIYRVQSNGKAPSGLQVGDQVVTGGGTWLITGVRPDGTYDSHLVNANQTTYTYTGPYAAAPSAPSYGGSSSAITEDNVGEVFSQRLGHVAQETYSPVVTPQTQVETMGFDEAVKLAQTVMAPQYEETFRRTAANASQRLEQAGLYDTLYGQALAADAERDVAAELNAAIYSLALQLSQSSADQALDLLKLAVTENQFGADYNAGQQSTALKYLYQMIQDLEARQAAQTL